jgi:hypothetical protein
VRIHQQRKPGATAQDEDARNAGVVLEQIARPVLQQQVDLQIVAIGLPQGVDGCAGPHDITQAANAKNQCPPPRFPVSQFRFVQH